MQNEMIEIPVVWAGFAAFVLFCVLIAKLPMSKYTGQKPPLMALQDRMGLAGLNSGLFFLVVLLWTLLFALLFGGLILTIFEIAQAPLPAFGDSDGIWAWRFSVLKLASLTAVLGAVVALPFTLLRLSLNRQQVETARDALFNDKIDVAVTDLYAQRQVTRWVKRTATYHNAWEDDITRRNGAIDRLEGLVEEDNSLSPRVSRMLSVYVRELSREDAKPEKMPVGLEGHALRKWAQCLTAKRSDMEKAVQTLGRLPVRADSKGDLVYPDLEGANLQAMRLNGLNFDKAILIGAQLQGADLDEAQLQGADLNDAKLQGVSLSRAQLQGAKLRETQLQGASLNWAQLQGAGLTNAQLQGASLRETQLQGANFSGAKLQGADLDDAQLQGADLNGAQLQGAMLTNAQLQGANLSSANLQGADLNGAQLQGADLSWARFDANIDFGGTSLRGARVRRVDFTSTPRIASHLEGLFGDDTVTLPPGVTAPERFQVKYNNHADFTKAWRAFQRSIGQDPDNPT